LFRNPPATFNHLGALSNLDKQANIYSTLHVVLLNCPQCLRNYYLTSQGPRNLFITTGGSKNFFGFASTTRIAGFSHLFHQFHLDLTTSPCADFRAARTSRSYCLACSNASVICIKGCGIPRYLRFVSLEDLNSHDEEHTF
jgi:hypothetical protein